MSGLECSEITVSELDKLQLRFDAEFYKKRNLEVAAIIDSLNHKTIENLKVIIDCSAFYPGVVEIYNFEGEGVPFIRVNEITNLGLVSVMDSTAFLPEDFLDENSSTIARCKPGDIVIAKGGNTLAKTGIISDSFSNYATCRDIVILRTDKLSSQMKYYIWAYLQSDYGQTLLWQTASQTGQPHLTLDYIKALNIPLFSDTFYSAIQYCYQRSQVINETANAKYQEAEKLLLLALDLDSFMPSKENTSIKTFSQVAGSGRLDAEYYQPKYDDIERKIKQGDYTTAFALRSSNDKNFTPLQKEKYTYIELADIEAHGSITDGCLIADSEELPSRARRIVSADDVIVSSIEGSLDRCAMIPAQYQGALCSTGFYVMRSEAINPETLLLLFKSYPVQMMMKRGCSGTILTAISSDELKKVPVPIPDVKTQKEIAEKVRHSFALREQGNSLLKAATRAVEIAIEQDEAAGMKYLQDAQQANGNK